MSLLICGWDTDRPYLFQCDPSGAYFPWKATAMGKNFINGKTFLEKRLALNVFLVIIIRIYLEHCMSLMRVFV